MPGMSIYKAALSITDVGSTGIARCSVCEVAGHAKQLCIKKHSLLRIEPDSASMINGNICMCEHEGG